MSIIAKAAACVAMLGVSASSAVAGPYVNIENNAGWAGNDYTGAVTDFHVGYEGPIGEGSSYYVQGGPALVAADGEESETEFSAKAGLGIGLTDSLGAYGEISGITAGDDTNYGTKVGLKYNF